MAEKEFTMLKIITYYEVQYDRRSDDHYSFFERFDSLEKAEAFVVTLKGHFWAILQQLHDVPTEMGETRFSVHSKGYAKKNEKDRRGSRKYGSKR